MADLPGYRFEPLQRRGLMFGLGPVEVATVGLAFVGSVAAVRAEPGVAGFALATGLLLGAALWCRPVRGRPPYQWAVLWLSFAFGERSALERPPATQLRVGPASGVLVTPGTGAPRGPKAPAGEAWLARLPCRAFVEGIWVGELEAAHGQGPVGVVLDTALGAATAVLRVRGGQFCLLDGPEKERKLAAWAGVLESLASERSALERLGWYQVARPDRGDEVLARLLASPRGARAGSHEPPRPGLAAGRPWAARELGEGGPARGTGEQGTGTVFAPAPEQGETASRRPGALVDLVERATQRSWRHETFLSVTVRCPLRRSGRAPSIVGDRAGEQLRNEVRALAGQLLRAGFACDGVLCARGLALAVASYFVPGLDRWPEAYPWPLSVEERWGEVRVEGSFHRTYWVAEWPRNRVGPDFLSGLLIGQGQRSFSVLMSPVPPAKAARQAESSRTAHAADAKLRAQGGFIETAQQRRRAEAVESREAELADGRGAYNFAGYLSVAGPTKAELEAACADLERAAGAARLCLRVLYGQQKEALSWALPLGRGL